MSDEKDDMDGKITRLIPTPYVRTGQTGKPEQAETEREDEQPGLGPSLADGYRAAGNPERREITRLVVIMGKDGFKPDAAAWHIFQYAHLDEGKGGFAANGEQWFSFLFSGRQPKVLTIWGRNLQHHADYISRHRMPWIRLADRDFRPGDDAPDDAPIITRVRIEDWQPVPE